MVKKDKPFQIAANFVMGFLAVLCVFPFLLMVISSFTSEMSLVRNGYSLFPEQWSLDAYKYVFSGATNIWRAYIVSTVVTVCGTAVNILLTTLLAYPLSRRDLPGKAFFSFYLFFTMLFNGGLIPSYVMWTQVFHIKNTLAALIIPSLLLNAFTVIIMRTNITVNIPEAVTEAARIDGAGEWTILAKIVLPMSKPIMATLLFMVGLIYWNDWTNGLYYVTKDIFYSVPVLLNRMLQDTQFMMSNSSSLGNMGPLPTSSLKMAIASIGALPVLLIYPFFQRYFIKGITIGAVKG